MLLPLTTARLVIRLPTIADAANVLAVYGDAHVLCYWNGEPLSGRAWALEQTAGHTARGYASEKAAPSAVLLVAMRTHIAAGT